MPKLSEGNRITRRAGRNVNITKTATTGAIMDGMQIYQKGIYK